MCAASLRPTSSELVRRRACRPWPVIPVRWKFVNPSALERGGRRCDRSGKRKKGGFATTGSIKLYSLSTCSHCKAAKKLLDQYNADYETTDVDLLDAVERAEAIAAVKKVNPGISFPTLLIGERVIIGYREDKIRDMSCPCRLASGSREWDQDIICPCLYREEDVSEYGSCYCGLYVSKEWNDGLRDKTPVPERRPIEKMNHF